jgi:hypothetical protein
MNRLRAIAMLAASASAETRWVEFRSDGFRLFSSAGNREARDTLVTLEQFRHALAKTLARTELGAGEAHVLFFRNARDAQAYLAGGTFQRGRERMTLVLVQDAPLGSKFWQDYARWLIEANIDRMPAAVERGLLGLFSTLEIQKTRITLGKPVPPAERDMEWARVHMVAVSEEYYGKLPVMLNNLQKGVDEEPAFRNAFGKSPAEIDKLAAAYLKAGNFSTVPISGRAIDPERDYPERAVSAGFMDTTLADLLREREMEAEYEALLSAAQKEPDAAKAAEQLTRASKIQPKRARPHVLLAQRESDPDKRIPRLKMAVSLERRDPRLWKLLAEAYQDAHLYPDAYKAWQGAEQASTTAEDRAKMRASRLDIERQRLDFEEAERKRIAEEKEREIRKLKEQAIAELRAVEARANKNDKAADPNEKIVPWWDGPRAEGNVRGQLVQVDCLGRQARLIIQAADGKTVKLMVRDPGQIAVVGAREQALGCGKQKPRKISVDFHPRPDARLATAGDVATIEFQ